MKPRFTGPLGEGKRHGKSRGTVYQGTVYINVHIKFVIKEKTLGPVYRGTRRRLSLTSSWWGISWVRGRRTHPQRRELAAWGTPWLGRCSWWKIVRCSSWSRIQPGRSPWIPCRRCSFQSQATRWVPGSRIWVSPGYCRSRRKRLVSRGVQCCTGSCTAVCSLHRQVRGSSLDYYFNITAENFIQVLQSIGENRVPIITQNVFSVGAYDKYLANTELNRSGKLSRHNI